MGSTPYPDFYLGWDQWLYSYFNPLHCNFRYSKDIFKLHHRRYLNKVCSCLWSTEKKNIHYILSPEEPGLGKSGEKAVVDLFTFVLQYVRNDNHRHAWMGKEKKINELVNALHTWSAWTGGFHLYGFC